MEYICGKKYSIKGGYLTGPVCFGHLRQNKKTRKTMQKSVKISRGNLLVDGNKSSLSFLLKSECIAGSPKSFKFKRN